MTGTLADAVEDSAYHSGSHLHDEEEGEAIEMSRMEGKRRGTEVSDDSGKDEVGLFFA